MPLTQKFSLRIRIRDIARRYIPRPLRPWYRQRIFRRAMNNLLTLSQPLNISTDLLCDLHYGWGNEGWSASNEFLRAGLDHAMTCKGNILECGSGLSTILMAYVAQRTGKSLLSLEHHPGWGQRVTEVLYAYGLSAARLHITPLRNYGNFDWYSIPANPPEHSFGLVICDGPPGSNFGGRFGLMPVAGSLINPEAKILLDDIERADERAVAERWMAEFDMTLEIRRSQKSFGILTKKISMFPN